MPLFILITHAEHRLSVNNVSVHFVFGKFTHQRVEFFVAAGYDIQIILYAFVLEKHVVGSPEKALLASV